MHEVSKEQEKERSLEEEIRNKNENLLIVDEKLNALLKFLKEVEQLVAEQPQLQDTVTSKLNPAGIDKFPASTGLQKSRSISAAGIDLGSNCCNFPQVELLSLISKKTIGRKLSKESS